MMNHINDCKNTIIFALCLLFSANWVSAQKDSTGVRKDTVAKVELIKEVSINARKKVFETDKGKLIFNVQNSALSTGQTALDLLKRVPGVSVGQNDQILFRGSPGINVVIDGKMTYLLGSQLASFLMGMSAEDITKIEIMTTPSSEFDAAGNAGIINIISRKNIKKGYAIDLRSSVSKGKYWMNNQNITSSFRTKKINLYSSFDFNTPHSYSKNQSGNTITDNGTVLQLSRNNESIYKVKYYTWRIGADWQFLARHSIGISYNGYFDDFKSFNYSTVDRLDHLGNLQSYIRSENKQIEPYHYDDVSMKYKFDMDSLGKNITADANYTSYRNFSDGLMTTDGYALNDVFLDRKVQKSHQPGSVKIKSFKADADLPFQKFRIKTGVKYAEVENDNQFRFDSLQAGNYVKIDALSNHFKYRERIAAAYLSGSKTFSKTSIEAGLRLEYTNADGYMVKRDLTNKWQYTKLFPSLTIEQIISDDHKLDFSVSRRINRPSYSDLNPVRWYTDQYFYYSGNPNLLPEMTWVSSLTYSLKSRYIFTAIYNRSNHFINRRLAIDDNGFTVRSMSDNFGKRQRFDFTTSISVKPLKFWDLQLFNDVSYTVYPISLQLGEKQVSKWSLSTMLEQDFTLPKDFSVNLVASFTTSELRGIYSTGPLGFVNIGVKKSFFNKKFVAQFSVSDLFNTTRYKAKSQTDIADYYYNDKPYSRVLSVSLKYHFGGELIKSSSRKTEEQERL
ncbi:outer membrane beta-barrel family protein [uncultured Chryseobacterium sp.]|uniref:outer membrane beta-barrel family protein n=1 Tax=uncultured Chryseobacterium sp. TaxID=259322 RepID=UPI0025FFA4C2|nr:outer membrane beta-barrel family protein [uncultured Chryseobacterium sp.]